MERCLLTIFVTTSLLIGCSMWHGKPGSLAWLRAASQDEIRSLSVRGKDTLCKYAAGAEHFEGVASALVESHTLSREQVDELAGRTKDLQTYPRVGDTRCHIFALMVQIDTGEHPELVSEYHQDGHHYQVLREAMGLTFGAKSKLGAEGCREFVLRDDIIVGVEPCPQPP